MKLNIQLFAARKSTTFSEPALTDAMISGNYSTLKITIKFSANNSVTYFNSKKLSCTCNGVTKSANVSLSKGGSVKKEFTFTNIEHNVEPKSVEWAWGIETGTSVLGYLEDDGTRTLQEIKRLGYFSGDKVTGNTIMGVNPSTLTLHYDIYNLDYTYKYVYSTPNNGVYTGNLTPTGLTDNTKELSFDALIFANNPTANDLDISFWIETYNGDALLGSDKTTYNVTLHPAIVPSIIIPNNYITEANTTMQSLNWGVYVKNKSQLYIRATMSTEMGATATSRTIEVDGTTYTPTYNPIIADDEVTTNYLKTAGTNTITATLTSSRNRTSTLTKTIDVVDYNNPTITSFEVQRCLSDGTIDKNGTYLIYSAVGSISPVNNNNDKLYRLGYKVQGTDNYTYVTLGTTYDINISNQISSFTISSSNIYDVVLEATDSFTTTSINRTIDVGFDLMNFNPSGKAMAIGKVSTATANQELLEVGLETDFENNVTMENDLSVDGTINQVGDLSTLITTANTDVVSAINEIAVYKPYSLFESSSGSTSNIQLSDSAANYNYLEVYYLYEASDTNYGEYFAKVYNPNGNKIALNMLVDSGNLYALYCNYSISGTTMTRGTPSQWRFTTANGNHTRSTPAGCFAITKVVGYK